RGHGSDELPLFPPPAGNPLAVRRATTEPARARRTTTRPIRMEPPSLPLMVEQTEEPAVQPAAPKVRAADAPAAAGTGGIAAALLDISLLLAIDAAVAWLTLRIAGLDATVEALAGLRTIPLVAFFLLLAFLY